MKNEKAPSGPVFESLDLTQAETWNGMEGYRDLIINRLRELGLYSPDLIYRGYDGNKIEVVKQYGTDIPASKIIDASKEGELADESRLEQSAIKFSIMAHDVGGLSVYDSNKFIGHVEGNPYSYQLREGATFEDALVAVFELDEK